MQKLVTHLQGTKKQVLAFTSTFTMLCLLLLLTTSLSWAKAYRILIVSSGDSPLYTQIVDTIQTTVSSNSTAPGTRVNTTLDVIYLKSISTTSQLQERTKNQDLILTIGQRAMILASKIKNSPPIITTLIPRQSFNQYRNALRKENRKVTALFIDSPPKRQILLAKILLGDLQRLGVLISKTSPYSTNNIQSAIQKQGINSHIQTVHNPENLIRNLSQVLNKSDAFLALPDAQIFNRRTARNILLTTYRQRTPVIAYSESYVKAGALAAVYSTPQQISKQIGELLLSILNSGLIFPAMNSHPREFEVAINQNVAKSLGIPTRKRAVIKNQLLKLLQAKE